MKQVTKEQINEFIKQKNIAFIGVSGNEKKFQNVLYNALKKKEYCLFPVNPGMTEFQSENCYSNVNQISEKIDAAVITTPKSETLKVLKQVNVKGIKHVWIQQGANSPEADEFAASTSMNVISNKCLFMFIEPVNGVHKFHKFFVKTFGKYPK